MMTKTMIVITMAKMMANSPASIIILSRRKMTMTKMMILMGRMIMATTKMMILMGRVMMAMTMITIILIRMPSTYPHIHSHQYLVKEQGDIEDEDNDDE